MKRSHWAALAVVLLVALGAWLVFGGGGGSPSGTPAPATPGSASSAAGGERTTAAPGERTTTSARSTRGPTRAATQGGATDPQSGLPWIAAAELPREARDTLELIDAGGPFPYAKDGSTFGNFEGLLPQQRRGYYREYTVDTPGSRNRGARRIVTGDNDRIFYWTDDHYESFSRIRR
ncbi:ribonuclease domain-containing protein [Ammonicoccus fulvus]|uniref:Ribonuclease domain-containing protein n=1 Tax=Ammonicoccus fulvus TaxID=3138240 RepID=A0ABZ3FQK0_9ACTN